MPKIPVVFGEDSLEQLDVQRVIWFACGAVLEHTLNGKKAYRYKVSRGWRDVPNLESARQAVIDEMIEGYGNMLMALDSLPPARTRPKKPARSGARRPGRSGSRTP